MDCLVTFVYSGLHLDEKKELCQLKGYMGFYLTERKNFSFLTCANLTHSTFRKEKHKQNPTQFKNLNQT